MHLTSHPILISTKGCNAEGIYNANKSKSLSENLDSPCVYNPKLMPPTESAPMKLAPPISDTARVVSILVTLGVCWLAFLFACSLILGRADVTLTPQAMERVAPIFLWLGAAAFTLACIFAIVRLLHFLRGKTRARKPINDRTTSNA